jgi:hypothetical protein
MSANYFIVLLLFSFGLFSASEVLAFDCLSLKSNAEVARCAEQEFGKGERVKGKNTGSNQSGNAKGAVGARSPSSNGSPRVEYPRQEVVQETRYVDFIVGWGLVGIYTAMAVVAIGLIFFFNYIGTSTSKKQTGRKAPGERAEEKAKGGKGTDGKAEKKAEFEATYYETLQVREDASAEVIRGAYKFLFQKWHPDKNQNSEESKRVSVLINRAYSVLSDPVKRREYDEWLHERDEMSHGSFGCANEEPKYESRKQSNDPSFSVEKYGPFWRICMIALALMSGCIAWALTIDLVAPFLGHERASLRFLRGSGFHGNGVIFGALISFFICHFVHKELFPKEKLSASVFGWKAFLWFSSFLTGIIGHGNLVKAIRYQDFFEFFAQFLVQAVAVCFILGMPVGLLGWLGGKIYLRGKKG